MSLMPFKQETSAGQCQALLATVSGARRSLWLCLQMGYTGYTPKLARFQGENDFLDQWI